MNGLNNFNNNNQYQNFNQQRNFQQNNMNQNSNQEMNNNNQDFNNKIKQDNDEGFILRASIFHYFKSEYNKYFEPGFYTLSAGIYEFADLVKNYRINGDNLLNRNINNQNMNQNNYNHNPPVNNFNQMNFQNQNINQYGNYQISQNNNFNQNFQNINNNNKYNDQQQFNNNFYSKNINNRFNNLNNDFQGNQNNQPIINNNQQYLNNGYNNNGPQFNLNPNNPRNNNQNNFNRNIQGNNNLLNNNNNNEKNILEFKSENNLMNNSEEIKLRGINKGRILNSRENNASNLENNVKNSNNNQMPKNVFSSTQYFEMINDKSNINDSNNRINNQSNYISIAECDDTEYLFLNNQNNLSQQNNKSYNKNISQNNNKINYVDNGSSIINNNFNNMNNNNMNNNNMNNNNRSNNNMSNNNMSNNNMNNNNINNNNNMNNNNMINSNNNNMSNNNMNDNNMNNTKNNNNTNNNETNDNKNNNRTNNTNNNNNNAIPNIFEDNETFEISNMNYPTPQELNGDEEGHNFSFGKDVVPEMSIMTEEELPSEIHNHPIIKAPFSDEVCIICNEKKSCQKGNKCNSCSFKMCENCVYLVVRQYYSSERHRHNLVIKEKDNYKCDVCKRNSEFRNKFCFYCDECNYGICLECFIPQIKNKEESIHEHPLKYKDSFPALVCKICGEEKKEGYKCNYCQMELCHNCYNNVKNKKGNFSHKHKLILDLKNDWNCAICKNKNKDKICFICKECNLNYCLNCFFK